MCIGATSIQPLDPPEVDPHECMHLVLWTADWVDCWARHPAPWWIDGCYGDTQPPTP